MRPQDFLEGVREAAACFYDAVVAGDDATLARMASSRVRQVVAQDMKMLAAVHGIQVRRAGGAGSAVKGRFPGTVSALSPQGTQVMPRVSCMVPVAGGSTRQSVERVLPTS